MPLSRRTAIPLLTRLAPLALAASLCGCAWMDVSESPYFNKDLYQKKPPQTLAVARIDNATTTEHAGERMRQALYGAFAPLRYRDVELARTDDFIRRRAMEKNENPEKLDPFFIAEPDLADAVLFGRVDRVSRLFLIFYSQISVDLSLQIVDSSTKEFLYRNAVTVKNRQFTIPTNPIEIFTSAFSSIWHLRAEEVAESFEEAGRAVAERYQKTVNDALPGPTAVARAEILTPPRPLHEGDKVEIRVKAPAGRKAAFTLGAVATNLPMEEKPPGEYVGVYVVKKGDNAAFIVASIVLADPSKPGELDSFNVDERPLTIDTTPPGAYYVESFSRDLDRPGALLKIAPQSGHPETGTPIVAYHVFRAAGSGGKLKPVGDATAAEFRDATAQAGHEYDYAVIAEDAAGNQGPMGPRATMKLEPGEAATPPPPPKEPAR